MQKWHYNKSMLVEALRQAGVMPGDVIFSHISLGRLGYAEEGKDIETLCNVLYGAFQEVLQDSGTLLIPTFTYSIGRNEPYDVQQTPSTVGPFSEFFRNLPGVIRSRDPMLSVAGKGPKAAMLLSTLPHTCYGVGCVYERLRKAGGKICNIGLGLYWATFLHHIEEMAGVPFRFKKMFRGDIHDNGIIKQESWIYFAAPFILNCQADALKIDKKARNCGICRSVPLGYSEIVCANAQEYFNFGMKELGKDPWLTAKGPPCDVDEIIKKENDRVGVRENKIHLSKGSSMEELIDALWQLPRDIISDGYDAALKALLGQVPMTIHEYPTGTDCWTWIIPEKWTCHEAYLEKADGTRLFSYSDNPLHVASYSQPFSGMVSRSKLLDHLSTHPQIPDAVPFKYNYYNRRWDLCCSQKLKESLVADSYKVEIKSDFSYGALKVGEVYVPGKSEDCIVLCAHLCHPAMVNDGLSGVVAGIEVMRRLLNSDQHRYSYRLLILPETIGSIAYLSHNEHLLSGMKGGLFLEMLGLVNPHALQLSYAGNTKFDRCCIHALKEHDPHGWTGKFLTVVTNDERQFNAPGVRIPMLSLSRVSQEGGFYKEYHSSYDSPGITQSKSLEDSCELVMNIIDIWENNFIPRNLFKGEVFLSRYDITFDFEKEPAASQALFDVMLMIDGTKSLIEIAEEAGISFHTAKKISDLFKQRGLVEYIE